MAFKMKGYSYPGKSPMKQGVIKPVPKNWKGTKEEWTKQEGEKNKEWVNEIKRRNKIINKNNPGGGGINLDDYKRKRKTPMQKASPPQKKSFLRDLKEAIKDFPEAMKQGPIKHAKQIASDIKSKIKGKKKK